MSDENVIETGEGSAGEAKELDPETAAARADAFRPESERELDERQKRLRPSRRPGGPDLDAETDARRRRGRARDRADRAGAGARRVVAPVALLKNIALTDADTGGQTSTVGEPSAACSGDEIFVSGNWYATKSLDGGSSWSSSIRTRCCPRPAPTSAATRASATTRAATSSSGCCSTCATPTGTNVLRLAVKKGGTLADDSWHWWDFSPKATDAAWSAEWFDYPDLELSDNFLYLTTNSFEGEDWRRSVVFRFSLDELAASGELTYRHWSTTENFSLALRERRRRGDALREPQQPEPGARLLVAGGGRRPVVPRRRRVGVECGRLTWRGGPDGTNWLQRCDPRITGAWVANGKIGLAWTANRRGPRPYPYVRVVEIGEEVVDRDIWSPDYAYAYPSAAPNEQREIGITLFRGGNAINPEHLVGVWDGAAEKWDLQVTASGTNGPADNKWGDYLACRRALPDALELARDGLHARGRRHADGRRAADRRLQTVTTTFPRACPSPR